MKIESSKVQMQAASTHKEELVKHEHLRAWVDEAPKQVVPSDVIQISAQGLEAQKTEALQSKEEELLADKDYLKLKLLEAMLSKMSGRHFKFRHIAIDLKGDRTQDKLNDALLQLKGKTTLQVENASIQAQQVTVQVQNGTVQLQEGEREGWGLDYHYSEQYTEVEQMSFNAQGSVALKDGRQIDFSVALHMSRSYSESFSMNIKAGDALRDPLAIDLTGKGINFSGETMHFDLDLDGKLDNLPVLSKGNGYLVLDRNNNQILDDGSELFGPKTNHGFDELAVHDQDQNGWIDENDDIFKSLKIWVSDGKGEGRLIGIVEAGMGAIFLGNANSAFSFKDGENNTLGKLKQTGVYLKENGQAGLIHEVDLRI